MKVLISLIVLALVLVSCATNPKLDPNYEKYLETQKSLAQMQPKLVEIKAQPGQTIELKGVQEFIVYAPSSSSTHIAIHRTPPDPATVIFSKLFDTALDASKSILPAYFGWHYGSHILSKAFDRAGGNYNITGDYNTGQMTKVQGDYTTGTKYQIGQDYTGQSKYTVGQDYTGTDKITTGEGEYVGQDQTTTTTTTTSTTTTTTTNTNGDNSTFTTP